MSESKKKNVKLKDMLNPVQYEVTQNNGTELLFAMNIGIIKKKAFM